MKKASVILVLLLLAAIHVFARGGFIAGKVFNQLNQPLAGVTVEVYQQGKLNKRAITANDGAYVLKELNAGSYDVKAIYNGYNSKVAKNVIVKEGKVSAINIVLNSAREKDLVKGRREDEVKAVDGIMVQHEYLYDKTANAPATKYEAKRSIAIGGCFPPAPYPGNYYPGTESYKKDAENDFKSVKLSPLSTLSVDVDRASYSNVRRFINEGQKPPVDAVRVEEMINYFDYNYPQPKGEDPIAIVTEMIDCPWKKGHKLLQVGMQAKEISAENLPASNLVFLIDVSGSMMTENKLPLVKSSLKLLVNKLREEDRVSIVVYAGSAGLVLSPTSGSDKETIYASLDRLQAGGSTAGGAGIELAYKTANENFMRGGNNRVILATDGDFNVGASGDNELEDLIVKQRNKGIYLTCLGYGMGNYKDSKMEVLADKGNGNYAYIDNVQEANKTLVKEFGGTIFTVAKDVKAQIEFNPKYVKSYRLVGYENRVLNAEDFKDDKKDAGEMGSGHTVTILYEIIPASSNDEAGDDLKYQQSTVTGSSEFATIKFRYKRPNADKSKEMVHVISPNTKRIDLASDNVRFASSVAMFGMLLKDSKYKGIGTYDMALALARSAKGKDKEGYRAEYIKLVKTMNDDKSIDSEDNSGLGWNGVD
jgi:Ca-activated chloride channel family protein